MTNSVDNIGHPTHYTWHPKVECHEVAEELTYNLGTALAYIWRCGRKCDPLEDIDKAIMHLQFERARLTSSAQPAVAAPVPSFEQDVISKYET